MNRVLVGEILIGFGLVVFCGVTFYACAKSSNPGPVPAKVYGYSADVDRGRGWNLP